MDFADELDPKTLQVATHLGDVIDQYPGHGMLEEVMCVVGRLEDLEGAAVWEGEDSGVSLFPLNAET